MILAGLVTSWLDFLRVGCDADALWVCGGRFLVVWFTWLPGCVLWLQCLSFVDLGDFASCFSFLWG